MGNIRNRKMRAGYAGLGAFVLLLALVAAVQIHARDQVNRSITIAMPACPIAAYSKPLTDSKFRIPRWNPLGGRYRLRARFR